jgi:hypothetical protein
MLFYYIIIIYVLSDFVIVFIYLFIVSCLCSCFLLNFKKVVDSRIQIRSIACSYPPLFYYLQEGSGKPFETFQPGGGYPLERVCMRSPLLI